MKIEFNIKGFRYENQETEDSVSADELNIRVDMSTLEVLDIIGKSSFAVDANVSVPGNIMKIIMENAKAVYDANSAKPDNDKPIKWPNNYGETKFIGIPINKINEEPTCPVCDKHNTNPTNMTDIVFNHIIKDNIIIEADTDISQIVLMSSKLMTALMKNNDVFSKDLKFEPFVNIFNKVKASYANAASIYAHDIVMEAVEASKKYDSIYGMPTK